MSNRLIDSHLHLQDPAFAPDLAEVLARASAAGVRRMVCNGTCEADWPAVAELARTHADVIACFGLHPWYVTTRSADWLTKLERYLDSIPSGVGEIGLDRWIEDRNEIAQEGVFRAQLDLARRKHRPATIHCLRAWGRLMEILRSEPPLSKGLLIHAYGGPAELVDDLAAMGAYFSFVGPVLDAKRTRARAALLAVPRDRLLLETDAPDLAPPEEHCPFGRETGRDKPRNEPGNLRAILRGVAELRGETEAELAKALWENGQRFFERLTDR